MASCEPLCRSSWVLRRILVSHMKWSFRSPISSRMKRGIPTGTEIQNAECTKTNFYAFARRMLAGPKYTCRQTRNIASQISCKTLSAKSKLLYAQNSEQSGERRRFAIKPSAKRPESDRLPLPFHRLRGIAAKTYAITPWVAHLAHENVAIDSHRAAIKNGTDALQMSK